MNRATLLVPILLIVCASVLHAQSDTLEGGAVPRDSLRYIVLMKSGDRFRGNLDSYSDSTVTILTEFGDVVIDKRLIRRFIPLSGPYRNRAEHFLMPTASAHGSGGFINDYELGFLYGGFGFGWGATITAGMTAIPGIPFSSQIYHLGAKFTVQDNADFGLAFGATHSWLTTEYPYTHIYGVATFHAGTLRYSLMMFYKATGADHGVIRVAPFNAVDTTEFKFFYEGDFGVAIGMDAPLFGRDDMYLVGEIWNNDIRKPGNTVSIAAIRVTNETLSADFGFALFTAPFVVPVMRFTWYL